MPSDEFLKAYKEKQIKYKINLIQFKKDYEESYQVDCIELKHLIHAESEIRQNEDFISVYKVCFEDNNITHQQPFHDEL